MLGFEHIAATFSVIANCLHPALRTSNAEFIAKRLAEEQSAIETLSAQDASNPHAALQ